LRGRTKDVISVLGAKFFPQEVESVLISHPLVAESCVFSRRDARLGEVPCALVVPADFQQPPTEDELLAYCRSRLAAFKIPERIEFVRRLPRTASGKLLHRVDTPSKELSQPNASHAIAIAASAR
jgi:acyl-coenzyme A synthetase/AMP-(fatty) acid ligase